MQEYVIGVDFVTLSVRALLMDVTEGKELGSHDMFIAEVLAVNADEKYFDKKGAFDIAKCNLIAYANGGYYALGKKVGKFGYSVQKKKKRQ